MRKFVENLVADVFLILMSGWMLAYFIALWWGPVTICEPNMWIRGIETAMLLGLAMFGLRRVIKDVKEG
jgi:hypothetical protein